MEGQVKQELNPADIVEEEEEEEEEDEEEEEEEGEEECPKFSPKHCQKLQFSIAQIMGFDNSEAKPNADQDIGGDPQDDGDDQGGQGDHQRDQTSGGGFSEEEDALTKDVKVRFIL